jgi:hypothetical protein
VSASVLSKSAKTGVGRAVWTIRLLRNACNNEAASRGNESNQRLGFTGAVPQQDRAQAIVRVVSQHALRAAASLMLKPMNSGR